MALKSCAAMLRATELRKKKARMMDWEEVKAKRPRARSAGSVEPEVEIGEPRLALMSLRAKVKDLKACDPAVGQG